MTKLKDYFKKLVAEQNERKPRAEKSPAAPAENERDKLAETLAGIDSDYASASSSGRLPDPPEYEKMEYDAPDDGEIRSKAESALEEYKRTSVENIESDAEAARQSKAREKESVAESAALAASKIEGSYDDAAREFSDDALKRGLARSSVAVNRSAELQSEKASAIARSAAEAENRAREIDSEISALELGRKQALDSFNIAYAAKVTEKIAELTEERDKKAAEVLKYNNVLLERQKKDAYDKAQLESKLESEYLGQLKAKDELGADDPALGEKNLAKYNAVRSYLLAMDKQDAASTVKTDGLVRDSLTDYYYYKLYNEFCK